MKRILPFVLLFPLLSACRQLNTIPYTPPQTPESWLQIQPFAEIQYGSSTFIFVQPSTSIIVYLLGIITIAAGVYYLQIRAGQNSRYWWGIALLLWGIGAILAGTSYEAFSYYIKCAGREACQWTSWWEIFYLIVSVWSVNAIVLAVANSSTKGGLRKWLSVYAFVSSILYLIIVLVGAFIPVKLLISFDFLLVFAAPEILALFILNGVRYFKLRQRTDLIHLGVWLWLGITIAAYFIYYLSGNTAALWEKGIWFSENDVLHIGLILWMLYITFILAPHVNDTSV
ncbi:MAG: hypothetical protein RL275_3211 [Chloroflexota bacterium]|jgi:hypothetical protein